MRTTLMTWKPASSLGVLLLLGLALSRVGICSAADAGKETVEQPRQVIDKVTHDVLALLANKDMALKEKRQKIQDIAFAYMDFEGLSRLTLGRNWRALTEAQRADFMKEYRTHMANTYRSMIDNYNDEQVQVTGEHREGDTEQSDRTVLTKITDPHSKEEFKVDYRLHFKDNKWRILDITIEGVSLVANFRSQFQDIISNGGFDKLMQLLRDKNAAAEKEEPKKKA